MAFNFFLSMLFFDFGAFEVSDKKIGSDLIDHLFNRFD